MLYADLAGTEDFLASHVLRVPGGMPPGSKEGSNVRETKSKAKQYSTINARTVVIKDAFVYSNKGFRTLNQAQLLNDAIYYPESKDNSQWLIYYISRPLVGSYQPITIVPAVLKISSERDDVQAEQLRNAAAEGIQGPATVMKKKDIKSFGELLNEFPMIARQMQAGLDKTFKELGQRFNENVPKRASSRPASVRSHNSSTSLEDSLATLRSSIADSDTLRPSMSSLDPEEEAMRTALETATNAVIDLFQSIDRQQLSILGTSTNLSGPQVERMIERYVAEQLHEKVIFPRLCSIHREEDYELESRTRRMGDIDIAQVGIPIEGGMSGKRKLALRLDEGVAVFKKQGVASSPQDMIETLLSTEKVIATGRAGSGTSDNEAEKQALSMSMNADTLVSMLLVVVIRSGVRHMNARLSYMRHFVFIEEVETGETGYAISTFEAVLAYLANDSEPLRRASRRNTQMWKAAREGDVSKLRSFLEPGKYWPAQPPIQEQGSHDQEVSSPSDTDASFEDTIRRAVEGSRSDSRTSDRDTSGTNGSLAHVFPFQSPPTPPPELEQPRKKRVSMAAIRSNSVSSGLSSTSHSRRESTNSLASNTFAADTTVDKLAQTQNTNGDSLLMMTIESNQIAPLKYLLSLEDVFTIDAILDDCSNEGSTLLSAAIQGGNSDLTQLLFEALLDRTQTEDIVKTYLRKQDSKGRCAAHYLFNMPHLLDNVGDLIPWRLRDKNGQTPLFALARSYDHKDYKWMVSKALQLATIAQGDGEPLHLDEHVDGKGNTLLHIINDAAIISQLLKYADVDVNAANDKRFTAFMLASKYGKMDTVRVLFGDSRTDLLPRDLRGLSAIELAKDDEIRNRIDDMVLLSTPPMADGRITTVVRSFFVEDATVRLIIKSGGPHDDGSITVTTCRRSLSDFENLAKWLSMEQPASWLQTNFNLPSPFLIPSRPSRAVLRDVQLRLDNFLRGLLTHATFSTHEMVWEFFLVPDIDQTLLQERSKRKAEIRVENVREEYEPIYDTHEVELFVAHAQEQVRRLSHSTKTLIRRTNKQRQINADMSNLASFASTALNTLTFLPDTHKTALTHWSRTHMPPDTNPLASLYYNLHSISSSSTALLSALHRPSLLIASMDQARRNIDRQISSLSRQSRWTPNITFFDETRRAINEEANEKAAKARRELEGLGCELRYTQQTVAAELAGWQDEHVRLGRRMLRDLAARTLVRERERLQGLKRAVREFKRT
ncbi:hypothetical protein MBLNU457_5664t1 [Dothideomycetes sp. NU457]